MTILRIDGAQCSLYTTVKTPDQYDVTQTQEEFRKLTNSLQEGEVVDLSNKISKYPLLNLALKGFKHNFATKVVDQVPQENKKIILVYLFHFNQSSVQVLLQHSELSRRLLTLLFIFAGHVVEKPQDKSILNYEHFMAQLGDYLDMVNKHLDVLMIPRLIYSIEVATNANVIWQTDVKSTEKFKQLKDVIFMGIHPITKIPSVLNYTINEQNTELSFEVTAVWSHFKEWIQKERIILNNEMINDRIAGNYIMTFNKDLELIYINSFDKAELGAIFNFPQRITSKSELKLDNLIKSNQMKASCIHLIEKMIDTKQPIDEIERPNIIFKLIMAEDDTFKGVTLMITSQILRKHLKIDEKSDIRYVLKGLNSNKDGELSDFDNSQSMNSNAVSFRSGMKGQIAPGELQFNKPRSISQLAKPMKEMPSDSSDKNYLSPNYVQDNFNIVRQKNIQKSGFFRQQSAINKTVHDPFSAKKEAEAQAEEVGDEEELQSMMDNSSEKNNSIGITGEYIRRRQDRRPSFSPAALAKLANIKPMQSGNFNKEEQEIEKKCEDMKESSLILPKNI